MVFITVTRNHCKDVLKAFWRRKVEVQSEVDLRNQDQGTLNLTEKLLLLTFSGFLEGHLFILL